MRISLNVQILLGAIAGVLLGLLLGHTPLPDSVTSSYLFGLDIAGRIFIDLLKMIVVPLVFTAIVSGITNLQKSSHGSRIWPTLIGYSLVTTSLAAITGLIAVNVFKPGANLNIHLFQQTMGNFHPRTMGLGEFSKALVNGIFTNPVAAMAQNNILGTVTFAVLSGIALNVLGERTATLTKLAHEAFELTLTIIGWILRLAPVGIMGLLAALVAKQSVHLLASLGEYIALVLGTTLFHGIITLPLLLWLVTRVSPWRFFNAMKEAMITAFSTSSSSATLPVSLRCVKANLKVDEHVVNFVLPIGSTLNMDGTALYEAMAALFVANLCGIHLDLFHQIIVMIMAMIVSVGAPGIPSAGMVTLIVVLQSVGLPAEAVAILIPIDRPLDTLRTVVNVEGDAIGACVVGRLLKK